MNTTEQALSVGRVGTREYNAANVVFDVEHFLGCMHFQDASPELLRQSAEVSQVALSSVWPQLLGADDLRLQRIGLSLEAVCDLLSSATKVSDDKECDMRRRATVRVCRAALYRIMWRLDGAVGQTIAAAWRAAERDSDGFKILERAVTGEYRPRLILRERHCALACFCSLGRLNRARTTSDYTARILINHGGNMRSHHRADKRNKTGGKGAKEAGL